MKRIAILAAAGALVATPAFGAWAAFAAEDSAGHDAAHVRVADRHHGENEPGDDHGRHHRHHGENEPGDDHGGHGHEPGDDHGGHGRHHRHDG
jgi:Ni/Co efflux regulator RcnB